jgi:hypothetical protein
MDDGVEFRVESLRSVDRSGDKLGWDRFAVTDQTGLLSGVYGSERI